MTERKPGTEPEPGTTSESTEPADVRVRRAYDAPGADDGTRVLVDRVWPRGLTKSALGADEWCKQVAPSTELRHWYAHDPDRFAEFTRRYRAELTQPEPAAALAHLRELTTQGPLTLLTATRDAELSQAAVLATVLAAEPASAPASTPRD